MTTTTDSARPPMLVPRPVDAEEVPRSSAVPTAATRHLSTAMYVDEELCRLANHGIYDQPRRLVAPSYGFDLRTVLGHGRRATRAHLVRDAVLTGTFVLMFGSIIGIPAMLLIGSLLGLLQWARAVWRLIADIVAQIRSGDYSDAGGIRARAMLLGAATLVVGASLFLLLPLIFTYITLTVLLSGAPAGQSTGGLLSLITGPVTGLWTVLFTCALGTAIWRQQQLEHLVPGAVPDRQPVSPRYDDIDRQQRGNVTVFSGPRPFVGSGVDTGTWGTAMRLLRAGESPLSPAPERERLFQQPPFSTGELLRAIRGRVGGLAHQAHPEHRLPGLVVEERVFLAGTEVADLRPELGSPEVAALVADPTRPARLYLAFRVVSWDGELVTNVYVHCALHGHTLYLELSGWALAPCRDEYRIVDDVRGSGSPAYLRAVFGSLLEMPRMAARAPFNLARFVLDKIATRSGRSRPHVKGYDFGAAVSIREAGASQLQPHSLQVHDVQKYARIIERQVVAAVYDFLDERGVDMTEFRQRALSILNTGIWHSGRGDVNMGDHSRFDTQISTRPGGDGRS